MIAPTRPGVLLTFATLPLGLALMLIDVHLWPIAAALSLFAVALIGLDISQTLGGQTLSDQTLADQTRGDQTRGSRHLTVQIDHRTSVGIGDPLPLTLIVTRHPVPGAPAWPLSLEATIDVLGPVSAPEPTVMSVPPLKARADSGAPSDSMAPIAVQETLTLAPEARGIILLQHLWLRWKGPLGLVHRTVSRPLSGHRIRVTPNLGPVRAAGLRWRQRNAQIGTRPQLSPGDGAEFEALRDHPPGLDLRFVDWKRSARHRSLISREFRAERNHHVILALDSGRLMAEPLEGLSRLDRAINAGLYLGWQALKNGDQLGLAAFDSHLRHFLPPCRGPQAFAHLRGLAAEIACSGEETNFTLGLAELERRLSRRALILLFTEFVDTVTAELLIDNLARLVRRHRLVFVTLRDPYLSHCVARRPLSMLDAAEAMMAHDLMRDRDRVFDRLARLGIDCLDVPHDALSVTVVNRYIALKERHRL